ncbi:unnamed protein product [Pylaiella littoralis]
MRWKVRPDIVLRGRHENKSKGALSAFWQDYKKVRVDWRARAGMRRDHFELALQHYMRIDGPSRDTCEGRIRYIWETRIRDNTHLGVVDVSCQPAKAKVGKRKPSLLAAQHKEESSAHRLTAQQQQQQQQQHFQRQEQQAYLQVCVCACVCICVMEEEEEEEEEGEASPCQGSTKVRLARDRRGFSPMEGTAAAAAVETPTAGWGPGELPWEWSVLTTGSAGWTAACPALGPLPAEAVVPRQRRPWGSEGGKGWTGWVTPTRLVC